MMEYTAVEGLKWFKVGVKGVHTETEQHDDDDVENRHELCAKSHTVQLHNLHLSRTNQSRSGREEMFDVLKEFYKIEFHIFLHSLHEFQIQVQS